VKNYYLDAYPRVRKHLNDNYFIVIQQGFTYDWHNFMPPPAYQNITIDFHEYQSFSQDDLDLTESQHLQKLCGTVKNAHEVQTLWGITGEWSSAYFKANSYPDQSQQVRIMF